MATSQIRSQIVGLLETSRRRGLYGDQAILRWTVAAIEILLQAELDRIEEKKSANFS